MTAAEIVARFEPGTPHWMIADAMQEHGLPEREIELMRWFGAWLIWDECGFPSLMTVASSEPLMAMITLIEEENPTEIFFEVETGLLVGDETPDVRRSGDDPWEVAEGYLREYHLDIGHYQEITCERCGGSGGSDEPAMSCLDCAGQGRRKVKLHRPPSMCPQNPLDLTPPPEHSSSAGWCDFCGDCPHTCQKCLRQRFDVEDCYCSECRHMSNV